MNVTFNKHDKVMRTGKNIHNLSSSYAGKKNWNISTPEFAVSSILKSLVYSWVSLCKYAVNLSGGQPQLY